MTESGRRRIVPLGLGLAMLAVVIAAALVPNAGAVAAAPTTNYGQSPSSSTSVPAWEYASIGAIVVLGLLIGLFVVMRRRRRPPPESWQGPSGPSSGAPPSGAMTSAPTPPPPEEPAAASYVEMPDDVGSPPPALGAPPASAAAAAPPSEAEPDIDSLMAELDKISGEILKRTPKKGAPTSTTDDGDDGPTN